MTTLLPAYLLVGDDELKQAKAKERIESYIDEAAKTFDYNFFDAELGIESAEVLAALNAFPIMGDRRLIFIAHGEKLDKELSEALVEYLKSPLESSILALQATKLAKNTRLYKAFSKIDSKAIVVSESKKRWELPDYAKKIAQGYNKQLDSDAARELVSRLGESTLLIDSELKKLSQMFPDQSTISLQMIEEQVSRVADVKPWDISDAMSQRNLPKVLILLKQMPNQSLLGLLSFCTARVRELLIAKVLIERGQAHLLASELGMQAWQVKNHMKWQSNFSELELRHALSAAADCELALKSSGDKQTAFILWLSELCAK